jgi:hypothetical protein
MTGTPGERPTLMLGWALRQPVVSVALQVAVLTTEMVPDGPEI